MKVRAERVPSRRRKLLRVDGCFQAEAQVTAAILGAWFPMLIIGIIAGNLLAHDGW